MNRPEDSPEDPARWSPAEGGRADTSYRLGRRWLAAVACTAVLALVLYLIS